MFWPSLVKLGSRTPEKALSAVTHALKLHVKTLFDFAQILYEV